MVRLRYCTMPDGNGPGEMVTTANTVNGDSVAAWLTFVVDTGEKPVNYPSEAGGRLERDTGVDDRRLVKIMNARASAEAFSIDVQGFCLIGQRPPIEDFYDDELVETRYSAATAELIASLTGADEVVVFDYTRRTDDPSIRETRQLRDPSRTVHNDYTPRSAVQRVRDFLGERAEALLERRFAIVNVWRSIAGPVLRAPMALCDARSVSDRDLIATERRARDRIGETYRVAHSPEQRWYYYPNMTVDEALIIKTFDSAGDGRACFAPHAAFDDPTTRSDAPPRVSIETRAFAFFKESG